MVGGFALGSQGEKALTDAWAYDAEVDTVVAKMEAYIDFLGQVQRRISELQTLVLKVNQETIQSLEELEQEVLRNRDFDPKRSRDAQRFQRAALLVKTLSELLKIPVLDKNGNLHPQSLAPYHRVL
jgi:oligoendopeptidase F